MSENFVLKGVIRCEVEIDLPNGDVIGHTWFGSHSQMHALADGDDGAARWWNWTCGTVSRALLGKLRERKPEWMRR